LFGYPQLHGDTSCSATWPRINSYISTRRANLSFIILLFFLWLLNFLYFLVNILLSFLFFFYSYNRTLNFLLLYFLLLWILIFLKFSLGYSCCAITNIFMRAFPSNIRRCFPRYNNIIINNKPIFIQVSLTFVIRELAAINNSTFSSTKSRSMRYYTWIICNRIWSFLIICYFLALSKSKTWFNMLILSNIRYNTNLSAGNIFWQLWQRFGRIIAILLVLFCEGEGLLLETTLFFLILLDP
jgi:hypothetical protein